MKSYTLWDNRGANLIGGFDNERDALSLVLSGIERNGPEDTDTLVLAIEDEHGRSKVLSQGQALAERARREFAGHSLTG